MKERRRIEREFGVPIAGDILEPARWTKTALKRLPEQGPLDFAGLFGRKAPVVVDLGCGNGRFLIGSAVWRPDHDHLGVDVLPLVLRYATRRGNQRGLVNLRFAACDGLTLVRSYLAPASVREIHCYHPQPYHDSRDAHRRLITPEFLALVYHALEPGGLLFLQTDNPPYWEYVRRVVPAFFEFHEQDRTWPDAPKGRTRREIIARRRGLPVQRGWAKKQTAWTAAELQAKMDALPLPRFDAGPRPRDIDELERE